MKIEVDMSPIRQTRWTGHLRRFLVGGLVTVATGLVARAFGPVIGGLFLAFPAIFPVGVAMIQKLENQKVGPGTRGDHARRATVAEAAGASMGSAGLLAFALTAWLASGSVDMLVALGIASGLWAVVAVTVWTTRRYLMSS